MVYNTAIQSFNKVIPMFLVLGLISDVELICLTFSLIYIHSKVGLESVIYDYVHSRLTSIVYLTILRIYNLNLVLYTIEFLL